MISAIVLSQNNELSIEKTLQNLTWCDERIVIDDFSTDNTVSIAKKYATVYTHRLHNDFAAQRNFGLEKAKNPWVLFVDSDEIVPPALAKEIQKSIEIDCAGFYLKRQDYLFDRKLLHGETSRVRLLRLAKKDKGIWTRPIHEIWEIKGVIGTLENPFDHFPHPDVAQFIEDINRYSTINAQFFYSQHIRVLWWHILAYPAAKFFVNYIWRLGFLDGTPGAIMALGMSMHSFLTRAKLWLLWHKHE